MRTTTSTFDTNGKTRRAPVATAFAALCLALPMSGLMGGTAFATATTSPSASTHGKSADAAGQNKADATPKPAPQAQPTPYTNQGGITTGSNTTKYETVSDQKGSTFTGKGGGQPSGDIHSPQPYSTADQNNTGANDTSASNPYKSTRNGDPSLNGNGGGQQVGQPCAACVGKADNKNPKGQAPNATDGNAGYECDRNHGIGRSNPAHTGCTAGSTTGGTTGGTTGTTTGGTTGSSTTGGGSTSGGGSTGGHGTGGGSTSGGSTSGGSTSGGGNGTANVTVTVNCYSVVVTSSKDISHVVVTFADGTSVKFDGLQGYRFEKSFTKALASATGKSATTSVTSYVSGSCTGGGTTGGTTGAGSTTGGSTGNGTGGSTGGNGTGGSTGATTGTTSGGGSTGGGDHGNKNGKITICHATGSASNPFVVITVNKNGSTSGHRAHGDDIIPPYSYNDHGTRVDLPGINWTAANQASFRNGCTPPPAVTCPNGQPMPASGVCGGGNGGGATCPNGAAMPASGNLADCNPPVVCPAGTSMVNGTCTPPSVCPAGTSMVNGTCVPPVTCPAGTSMAPGSTSCTPPVVCPAGTTMGANGTCNPPVVCPAGAMVGPIVPGTTRPGCEVGGDVAGENGGGASGPGTPGTTPVPSVISNGGTAQPVLGGAPAPAAAPTVVAARPAALPFTGGNAGLLAEGAALLLLIGGGLVVAGRRKADAAV